jgi:hypothetical protein
MREYRFDVASTIERGQTVFMVKNAGAMAHELLLSPWPEDYPPVKDAIGPNRRGRAVQLLGRVTPQPPGEEGAFAVQLEPGRYAMACFVKDPDGRSHVDKGMVGEIRVT